MITKTLVSLAATKALGEELAQDLKRGDVVYLTGELGAGKTTLAAAIIGALTGEHHITSPTFTLVQEYQTPDFPLWHADLYRLESPEEFFELGLAESAPSGILLIEWPQRLGPYGFKNPWKVHLQEQDNHRIATIKKAIL